MNNKYKYSHPPNLKLTCIKTPSHGEYQFITVPWESSFHWEQISIYWYITYWERGEVSNGKSIKALISCPGNFNWQLHQRDHVSMVNLIKCKTKDRWCISTFLVTVTKQPTRISSGGERADFTPSSRVRPSVVVGSWGSCSHCIRGEKQRGMNSGALLTVSILCSPGLQSKVSTFRTGILTSVSLI